jgi:hypothetical protein
MASPAVAPRKGLTRGVFNSTKIKNAPPAILRRALLAEGAGREGLTYDDCILLLA